MGERTSHPHGTHSWADLVTPDAAAAKDFYTRLFGWEYDDRPVGDGAVYSMAMRDGKAVAALSQSTDQPPHWNCYVTVDAVDDTAGRVGDLGGTVMAPPFDVMDVGRMAVVADPAGAALCLWEDRGNPGAELVNAPGAMTWDDLITPDIEGARRFYGDLLGWTFEEVPGGEGYTTILNGGRMNGGLFPRPEGDPTPPSWFPYFGHEDVDALLGEIEGYGGRVLRGPMRMPNGSIAIVADPQGAVFAVWTGEYED
jgi:uncharacterized protein